MPRTKKTPKTTLEPVDQLEVVKAAVVEPSVGVSDLAAALVQAINSTKGPEKKNAFNRKALTPWTPKDGSKKLKFRRKMFQHGLLIDEDFCTNDQIALFNKLKPGLYLDKWVKVIKRRDRGIDIDYPIKTASQRLKLVSTFGIRNIDELLQRCIDEHEIQKTTPIAELDFD